MFKAEWRWVRFAAIAALVLCVGLSTGWVARANQAGDDENLYENLAIFSDILQKLRSEYVEPVKSDELIQKSIEGMLSSLDPYTQYLDPDQYKYLMQGTQGSFGGLGIEIAIRDGILTVVSPIEGTPAYRMGIQGGDRIIKIDGQTTEGITSAEAVKRLRGPRGTQVTLTIAREGVPRPLDYTVTRDMIKIESVPYSFMLDGRVGYVRISQFAEDTATELQLRLGELAKQNPSGIILDLRYNPGGLLTQAVEVADLFLQPGELVVSTRGRRPQLNREYKSEVPGMNIKVPVIVLVNGASASAAEIVAGAIQDWDVGLVVGTRTFGKGSVQTVVPLKHGGGALKITTAKYFTPSGRCIHRDEETTQALLAAADEEEAPEEAAPVKIRPASEKPEEATTFRTFHGRVLEGGWGIHPDVEIEQSDRGELVSDLERRTLFFKFIIKWLAGHPEVTAVPTAEKAPLDDFVTFLRSDEQVDLTPQQIADNKEYIVRALRRELALKLEGHEAAVRMALEGDSQLREAAKLFQEAPTLSGLFSLAEARAAKAAATAATTAGLSE